MMVEPGKGAGLIADVTLLVRQFGVTVKVNRVLGQYAVISNDATKPSPLA